MSFLPERPNRRVIAEFIDSLDSDTRDHMSDYFRDIHTKEILENFPLPALSDQERTDLNEYLKAGCFDYK